jgi:hypothetical protein
MHGTCLYTVCTALIVYAGLTDPGLESMQGILLFPANILSLPTMREDCVRHRENCALSLSLFAVLLLREHVTIARPHHIT